MWKNVDLTCTFKLLSVCILQHSNQVIQNPSCISYMRTTNEVQHLTRAKDNSSAGKEIRCFNVMWSSHCIMPWPISVKVRKFITMVITVLWNDILDTAYRRSSSRHNKVALLRVSQYLSRFQLCHVFKPHVGRQITNVPSFLYILDYAQLFGRPRLFSVRKGLNQTKQ
jgi:sensor histidine kinase YesM